jgi:hypothetical protein
MFKFRNLLSLRTSDQVITFRRRLVSVFIAFSKDSLASSIEKSGQINL